MARALSVHAERKRAELTLRTKRLRPEPIGARLSSASTRLAELDQRRHHGLRRRLVAAWQKLEALDKLLDAFSLSKESVLQRGYALVHGPNGAVLSKAAEVPAGAALELEFADGRVSAVAGAGAMTPKRPRRRTLAPNPDQGTLFGPPSDKDGD
jgi:exodeoxyribonuclease VII large subunit